MTIKLKSTILQMLWLIAVGGVLIIWSCCSQSVILMGQFGEELSKFAAQKYSLITVSLIFLRTISPATAGLTLAYLAPLISILAYLRIKKEDIEDAGKSKILLSSKFSSLILATLILTILGATAGIFSAYRGSSRDLQILFDSIDIRDILVSILKGIIFGAALAGVGVFQIKQFFKRPNLVPTILIAILTIVFGLLAIVFLDAGLTALFYFVLKI